MSVPGLVPTERQKPVPGERCKRRKRKNEKKNGRRHAVADADWTLAQGDLIEIPERRQFLHVKKPVQFLPDRERTPKTSPLA